MQWRLLVPSARRSPMVLSVTSSTSWAAADRRRFRPHRLATRHRPKRRSPSGHSAGLPDSAASMARRLGATVPEAGSLPDPLAAVAVATREPISFLASEHHYDRVGTRVTHRRCRSAAASSDRRTQTPARCKSKGRQLRSVRAGPPPSSSRRPCWRATIFATR